MELNSDYQKNIFTDRYQKGEETLDETFQRVAKFASSSKVKPYGWGKRKQETQFYELLSSGLHVPGGRVLANAGGNNMIYNCFVIDIEDSRAGIIKTLGDFTEIASKGGGIGINFSPIRPRGAYVKGSEAVASGPCSFIDMFQAAAETIKQGGCLSGETLVSTNQGLIKVKDIVEKELDVKIWTEDGWKEIVHYWDNGEKPVYKITTESGKTIRCTEDHKFETIAKELTKSQIYEMRSLGSGLIEGDYLISLIPDDHSFSEILLDNTDYKKSKYASSLNEDVKFPKFLTKDLAYLIGLIFADGYTHQQKAIKIAVSPDQEYIEKNIARIVDKLFGLSIYKNKGDGCISVSFYSRLLIEWLLENGLLKTEKALNIEIPEKIFTASKKIKLAFLAGFFDGDGCNGGSKSGLMFSTISERFASEISLLLLSCGLLSRIYKNTRSGNRHNLYTVTVVCDDFKILQKEFVGFSKKASRYSGSASTIRHAFPFNVYHEGLISNQLARQYGLTQNKCYQQTARNFINRVPVGESETIDAMRDRYPEKIISIEPCGSERVYDLEVKGTHKYLANGLYLSNSRGLAAMAVLNCDHPDIFEFVERKSGGETIWNNFNVSVGITDAFMDAVKSNADWELKFDGTTHKTIRARKLWSAICTAAWGSGEPGVLFLDTINRRNPISYVGEIQATNPCGEVPTMAYSACNLGSLNLPAFIQDGEMNWGLLQKTVHTAVAFHDNLIDQSVYPIEQIKEMALSIRTIGIGAMGLADWLFLQELPYGEKSKEAVRVLFKTISDHAMEASRQLGEELGVFPSFDSKYDDNPRRNSTLISFAPTGSIASMYNVSHGIEPHFAPMTYKNEELGKHVVGVPVIEQWMTEHNTEEIPEWARFVLNAPFDQDLEVNDHLAILEAAAEVADLGVSKTVNMPEDADVDDVESVFMGAWESGLIKGCTIYRDGSRDVQALSSTDFEDDVSHGELASLVIATKRPPTLGGKTYRIKPQPGGAWLYITINDYEDVPMEIFFASRNAIHQEYLGVLGDVLTTLFRRGEPAVHIVKDLLKHQGASGGGWFEGQYIPSVAAAIGIIMKKHYQYLGIMPGDVSEKKDTNGSNMMRCPHCGEYRLIVQEGCKNCLACGYSKCG